MMFSHRAVIRTRYAFHHSRLLQLGVLIGFWCFGQAIAQFFRLPAPGGVIGLAAVLALLLARRISVSSIRRGAKMLLAEMLLFFVPAVMALLDHSEFLGVLGLEAARRDFDRNLMRDGGDRADGRPLRALDDASCR